MKSLLRLFSFLLTSFACLAAPTTVPTFHCMSLYWPCDNGAVTNRCDVAYRKAGTEAWRQAQELWWDATHRFYAGAVVALEAGADYEFKLSLASGEQTVLRDRTWPDRFPIARTVTLPQGTQHQALRITEGGTAGGFVLYEAHPDGTTIDADATGGEEADALEHGIVVEADYVIIRGLTLRNAKQHGILIKNRHDVVIEGCDISNWGRKDPQAGQRGTVQRYANGGPVEVTFSPTLAMHMDCAIKGEGAATHDIERVVVQGNRIHHPRYGANSWSEGSAFFKSFHPQGAKAVCLFRPGEELPTRGNHVIRYNEFFSDRERMFYDILFDSQGSGPLQGTDAQRDIDIYGNIFRDCWDDCIELERGFGNIRVFENYFDHIFKASTGFTSKSGPSYIFRNVFDHVLQPSRVLAPDTRAWTGGAYQCNEHRLFFYHNTMLCPGGEEGDGFCWAYGNDYKQINQGRGTVDDGNFTISRNNIYQTIRWPDEVNHVTRRLHGGFSFDYDLYNGVLDTTIPEATAMWGRHAIHGVPTYRGGHGSGHPGRTQLAEKSPGKDQGCVLPNFNDHHEGTAPDIGAHEFGTPDMKLGVEAFRQLGAAPPTVRQATAALKPVVSKNSGLLLEPPVDLSQFSREEFLRVSSTVGADRINKKWTTAITPLPPHGRTQVMGLTEAEVQAYMRTARQLFESGKSTPISDVGLVSSQEDVVRRPMFNHVAGFSNETAHVYLLVQKTTLNEHWGYFSIVQDRTTQPPMNYFAELKEREIKMEAVSCYKCHASGPLAIHPAREDLVNDPALLKDFNDHIAALPLSRMHYPAHDPAPAYGEPLSLPACAKCHAEDADRAPLFRAHAHSIRVLVDFGHMPPRRPLSPADLTTLKAWLHSSK